MTRWILGFIIGALVASFHIVPAQALTRVATVSVTPNGGNLTVGKAVTVTLSLNTGGQPVTVVGLDVHYTGLEYVSFSSTNSVFSSSIKDPSPSNNTLRIERARIDSGYNGTNGLILKLTFKPIQGKDASVTIQQDQSEVDAAVDDPDPNILKQVNNAYFAVAAAASPTTTATPRATPRATATPTPSPIAVSPIPLTPASTTPIVTNETPTSVTIPWAQILVPIGIVIIGLVALAAGLLASKRKKITQANPPIVPPPTE